MVVTRKTANRCLTIGWFVILTIYLAAYLLGIGLWVSTMPHLFTGWVVAAAGFAVAMILIVMGHYLRYWYCRYIAIPLLKHYFPSGTSSTG